MPASREIPYNDKFEDLAVRVEPVESKDIHFTEDAPEFDIIVENDMDREIISKKDYGMFWVLGVGREHSEQHHHGTVGIDLEPGEVHRERIGGEQLAFEGTGVVGINTGMSLQGLNEDHEITVDPQHPTRGGYRWLYTFTVWDEEHYHAIHEQPKQLLRTSTRLSWGVLIAAIITAVVGLTQLLVALGFVNPF